MLPTMKFTLLIIFFTAPVLLIAQDTDSTLQQRLQTLKQEQVALQNQLDDLKQNEPEATSTSIQIGIKAIEKKVDSLDQLLNPNAINDIEPEQYKKWQLERDQWRDSLSELRALKKRITDYLTQKSEIEGRLVEVNRDIPFVAEILKLNTESAERVAEIQKEIDLARNKNIELRQSTVQSFAGSVSTLKLDAYSKVASINLNEVLIVLPDNANNVAGNWLKSIMDLGSLGLGIIAYDQLSNDKQEDDIFGTVSAVFSAGLIAWKQISENKKTVERDSESESFLQQFVEGSTRNILFGNIIREYDSNLVAYKRKIEHLTNSIEFNDESNPLYVDLDYFPPDSVLSAAEAILLDFTNAIGFNKAIISQANDLLTFAGGGEELLSKTGKSKLTDLIKSQLEYIEAAEGAREKLRTQIRILRGFSKDVVTSEEN